MAQAKEESLHTPPLQASGAPHQVALTGPRGSPSSLSPQPLTVRGPEPAAVPPLPAGLSHPASGAAEDRQGSEEGPREEGKRCSGDEEGPRT